MKHLSLSLALLAAGTSALAQHRAPAPTLTSAQRASQQAAHPTPPPPAAPPVAPPATPPPPSAGLPVVERQGGLNADDVMARVQSFYDQTQDFQATFTQDSRNAATSVVTHQTGTLRILKPGRMRWDYTLPLNNLLVSDGTTLWTYEPAAHQAFQVPLAQSQMPAALSFLLGTGRLSTSFHGRLISPEAAGYPRGYVLELRPVDTNPSVDRVLFFLEPAHFQLVTLVVFDAQGNRNTITLTAPQVNVHPAPSVFHWTPPAGTQIVRP